MDYFKEKADLKFLEDFKSELQRYYVYKNTLDNSLAQSPLPSYLYSQAEPGIARQLFEDYDDYEALRTQIAKDKNRAHRIGHGLGVGIGVTSYPAPAVGGPVLRFNIFDAVLEDLSHGQRMSQQNIFDKLNEIISVCEESSDEAWRHLVNL